MSAPQRRALHAIFAIQEQARDAHQVVLAAACEAPEDAALAAAAGDVAVAAAKLKAALLRLPPRQERRAGQLRLV